MRDASTGTEEDALCGPSDAAAGGAAIAADDGRHRGDGDTEAAAGAAAYDSLDALVAGVHGGQMDEELWYLLFEHGDEFEELVVALAERANALASRHARGGAADAGADGSEEMGHPCAEQQPGQECSSQAGGEQLDVLHEAAQAAPASAAAAPSKPERLQQQTPAGGPSGAGAPKPTAALAPAAALPSSVRKLAAAVPDTGLVTRNLWSQLSLGVSGTQEAPRAPLRPGAPVAAAAAGGDDRSSSLGGSESHGGGGGSGGGGGGTGTGNVARSPRGRRSVAPARNGDADEDAGSSKPRGHGKRTRSRSAGRRR